MATMRHRLTVAVLLALTPVGMGAGQNGSWAIFQDATSGCSVSYPSDDRGLVCSVGKYGAPYDEQFGCAPAEPTPANRSSRLLILPVKNTRGFFEHNVETSYLRAGPTEVMDKLSQLRISHGYLERPLVTIDTVETVRFSRNGASSTREVWYVRCGDPFLEINLRYPTSSRQDSQYETLERIIGAIEYHPSAGR